MGNPKSKGRLLASLKNMPKQAKGSTIKNSTILLCRGKENISIFSLGKIKRQIIYNMANRIWTIRNTGEGCKQVSLIQMSLFAMLGFWKVSFNRSMGALKCIMPIGEIAPQLREFS